MNVEDFFSRIRGADLDALALGVLRRKDGEADEGYRARLVRMHTSIGSSVGAKGELVIRKEYRPAFNYQKARSIQRLFFWGLFAVCAGTLGMVIAAVLWLGLDWADPVLLYTSGMTLLCLGSLIFYGPLTIRHIRQLAAKSKSPKKIELSDPV